MVSLSKKVEGLLVLNGKLIQENKKLRKEVTLLKKNIKSSKKSRQSDGGVQTGQAIRATSTSQPQVNIAMNVCQDGVNQNSVAPHIAASLDHKLTEIELDDKTFKSYTKDIPAYPEYPVERNRSSKIPNISTNPESRAADAAVVEADGWWKWMGSNIKSTWSWLKGIRFCFCPDNV